MAARRKLLGFGKIYLKTIIREIKRSFGRFVAIFGIVALGVGFLAGLLATTPDMKASVGTYYEDTNMSDIFIKATMGLTDADIAAVASLEEVQQVMPASVTDALVQVNGGELLVTRIYGVPLDRLRTELSNTEPLNTDNVQPFLNKIELIEGRLPESPNECVIQQSGGYIVPLEPGTALTISPDNRDYDTFADIYSVMEYTVTGIVKSPLYFSNEREPSFIGNGRLAAVMYVPSEAYALEAYTDLNVLLKGSSSVGAFSSGERSAGAFSADYDNLVSEAVKLLEPLGEERSQLRYDEIVSEAESLINEGETEYNTAKADAEKELAAARAKLNDGRQEIIDGETRLSNAEIQLEEGRE
ncbi:MAG: ABC transporter permease, partial [Spirochaetaceae bacterium]|nr:ABC transporter permease [Spirochaetaceae bacterium]